MKQFATFRPNALFSIGLGALVLVGGCITRPDGRSVPTNDAPVESIAARSDASAGGAKDAPELHTRLDHHGSVGSDDIVAVWLDFSGPPSMLGTLPGTMIIRNNTDQLQTFSAVLQVLDIYGADVVPPILQPTTTLSAQSQSSAIPVEIPSLADGYHQAVVTAMASTIAGDYIGVGNVFIRTESPRVITVGFHDWYSNSGISDVGAPF